MQSIAHKEIRCSGGSVYIPLNKGPGTRSLLVPPLLWATPSKGMIELKDF